MAPVHAQSPEQIHLTLTADARLVVQWAVKEPYAPDDAPRVVFATADGQEQQAPAMLVGATQWFWSVDPSGEPADVDTGPTYTYAADLPHLASGSDVAYRVGSPRAGFSDLHHTRAPPGPDAAVTLVAFGDIGYDGVLDDGSVTEDSPPGLVRARAIEQRPHAVIIPGDLSYDNSNRGWDRFMRFLEPLAATAPTMPVAGNHDYFDLQLAPRFVLPRNEHHFAFAVGPVTLVGLDSERVCATPYRPDASQAHGGAPLFPAPRAARADAGVGCEWGVPDLETLRFLDATLQAACTDDTTWTIVYHHRTTYSHSRSRPDPDISTHWLPLYEKHCVDLVVIGHDHSYSRTHPIREGVRVGEREDVYVQGEGLVHVLAGGGGRRLYGVPDSAPPPWLAHAEPVHHVVRIDVSSDALVVTAIEARNGTVIDRFEILRDVPAAGPPRDQDRPIDGTRGIPLPPVVLLVAFAVAGRFARATRKFRCGTSR